MLELGAGIGRFTGELAKEAGHVLALDFIDSVIKKVSVLHSSIFSGRGQAKCSYSAELQIHVDQFCDSASSDDDLYWSALPAE